MPDGSIAVSGKFREDCLVARAWKQAPMVIYIQVLPWILLTSTDTTSCWKCQRSLDRGRFIVDQAHWKLEHFIVEFAWWAFWQPQSAFKSPHNTWHVTARQVLHLQQSWKLCRKQPGRKRMKPHNNTLRCTAPRMSSRTCWCCHVFDRQMWRSRFGHDAVQRLPAGMGIMMLDQTGSFHLVSTRSKQRCSWGSFNTPAISVRILRVSLFGFSRWLVYDLRLSITVAVADNASVLAFLRWRASCAGGCLSRRVDGTRVCQCLPVFLRVFFTSLMKTWRHLSLRKWQHDATSVVFNVPRQPYWGAQRTL